MQILNDLKTVKAGASIIKFFIGPFGSGKTFIQALIQQIALIENFVVGKVDFTPERRLYSSDGKSLATYTEYMKSLSVITFPEGNALPVILDKWISDVQTKIMQEKGYDVVPFNDPSFIKDVEQEIASIASKLDGLSGSFDFSRILIQYYAGFVKDNNNLQRCALRWLQGEYTTKTEARSDLGVRDIIDDANYLNYIKVMSQFVRQIGYSGLVVNFDEAINLYKITHPQTRDKNYETILRIYNDTLQGNTEGLYVTFSGTPEFLEDERRGLFSYDALKSRLATNRYENKEFRDLSQPVVKVTPLKHEELFVLLNNLVAVHSFHYEYQPTVTEQEIKNFIIHEYSLPGATGNLTIRDIVKTFIGALNILQQHPDYDRTQIFSGPQEEAPHLKISGGRFQSTRL